MEEKDLQDITKKNQKVIDAPFDHMNLVEFISKEQLEEIGPTVCEDFTSDIEDMSEWSELRKKWLKLYMAYRDKKNFPWDNAANIAVPMLSEDCIQFYSRATGLMPAKDKVKVDAVGGEDSLRAERVEKCMNYQLNYDMPDFEEGWDNSMAQLPINGSCFRKTYYDSYLKKNVSINCTVDEVIVPYSTKQTMKPSRFTHIIPMSLNDIRLRQKAGIFIGTDDFGVGSESMKDLVSIGKEVQKMEGVQNTPKKKSMPRILLEQHREWDLDGDGIQEPYVITVDKETEKTIRIVKRQDIVDGHVTEIDHFTHYYFLPNPEGYLGLGFGHLVGGLNEAADALMNQIIDAGTLANSGNLGGFVDKRSGIKKGDLSFKMGEFKAVDVKGDDIRKSLFQWNFPGANPSSFAALNLLMGMESSVSTVTDITVGQAPRSDTTAAANLSAKEENQMVFLAIVKRIHTILKKELEKIYKLNSIYLSDVDYRTILGDQFVARHEQMGEKVDVKADFGDGFDVKPVSDPNILSKREKVEIYQMALQDPDIVNNPESRIALKNELYEALGNGRINKYITPPPPPPDLPQVEENSMFLMEQNSTVLPEQNHLDHLEVIMDFEKSTWFNELTPMGKDLLDRHKKEHLGYQYKAEMEGQMGEEQEMEGVIDNEAGNEGMGNG